MYIEITYDDNVVKIIEKYDSCVIVDGSYALIKDGKNKLCIPLCRVYAIQELDMEVE